ncbi:hypothetical protein GRI39_02410 [Altererythrobacter indicus]|uniref:Uncharacterized protein n=1 Tax=Altericroceibacterium indicum TaxID=374177 RepID=A0A845ACI9_9SPHN|nr:DUF5818 domain-containing protein [Altericroceibacterium indicum]MXP24898.1 hypothetical protein [Altericroceibacterium indicum]
MLAQNGILLVLPHMKITFPLFTLCLVWVVSLSGCANEGTASTGHPPADAGNGGESEMITKQGWVRQGIECPVLQTDDGEMWALSLGDSGAKIGDYVKVSGNVAAMSICMQGKGTISPTKIETLKAPAED